MVDMNCENCSGTGTSFGKSCACLEPAQTRLAKLLVSKLDLQYEVATDVLSIAGIRYAATMFRQLGGALPVGQLFSIASRNDGVLAIQRHPVEKASGLSDHGTIPTGVSGYRDVAGNLCSTYPDGKKRILVAVPDESPTDAEGAGVLPELPPTRYNGCGDGSEPLYTPEMMQDYANEAVRRAASGAGDLSGPAATDWLEFVRRAKLIYNEGDEGMQALDYLLALVDTSITAADLVKQGGA